MNKPFLVSVGIISVAAVAVMQLNNYLDQQSANADVRSIKHSLVDTQAIEAQFAKNVLPKLKQHLTSANMHYKQFSCSDNNVCMLQLGVKHTDTELYNIDNVVTQVKVHQDAMGLASIAVSEKEQLASGDLNYKLALALKDN